VARAVSAGATPTSRLRIAVIGGGWAGLAAAIDATRRGHEVALFEMAPQLGGRARRVETDGLALDNGQHILIGAYRRTLQLMAFVGADLEVVLKRLPLSLLDRRGDGLVLGGGPPPLALALAVLRRRGWSFAERLAMLRAASGWAMRGFRCDPSWTVATLCAELPPALRRGLIEPLAVAALNTPVAEASAAVFLRVLRDALLAGPGSADLLLPRVPLDELLPAPALRWLQKAGAAVTCGRRIQRIEPGAVAGWRVDGETYDGVVLAASPVESARLVAPINERWAGDARRLEHQPIATVYLSGDASLPSPMLMLDSDDDARPAQFAFDLGALGREPGLCAFVASAAAAWLDRGVEQLEAGVLMQAREAAPHGSWQLARTLIDRRATFACTPAAQRPVAVVAPGLVAAGDYVDGPYPGTLEGAVASGLAAVAALSSCKRQFRDAK
jgi:squalene-associated FAD-dependent desaturase